jgi:hypothetical protein
MHVSPAYLGARGGAPQAQPADAGAVITASAPRALLAGEAAKLAALAEQAAAVIEPKLGATGKDKLAAALRVLRAEIGTVASLPPGRVLGGGETANVISVLASFWSVAHEEGDRRGLLPNIVPTRTILLAARRRNAAPATRTVGQSAQAAAAAATAAAGDKIPTWGWITIGAAVALVVGGIIVAIFWPKAPKFGELPEPEEEPAAA